MIKAETNQGKRTTNVEAKGTTAEIMLELTNINIHVINGICEETGKNPKHLLNLLCATMNHYYYDLIGGSEDD